MSTILPPVQYHYTQDQSLELLIHGIKGNRACKSERKSFNLCRANLLGKYVEPQFCLDKAVSFVNCYQNIRKDERAGCKDKFNKVFECSKAYDSAGTFSWPSSCSQQLDDYLSC